MFLLIEQQPVNRERRIRIYKKFENQSNSYNLKDVTKDYKIYLPEMLDHLDKQLYINAIFSVNHSKYEALVIVKHNNILKYCLTGETKLDESVKIY
jgi:hypothetical protein